jgi:predicted pyridoxine 5'-phosphate oxidase superfamily flavin-nucleotide-binding protein
VDERYHQGSRELQDAFDSRRLADRIVERVEHAAIDADDRAFIERMDMFFLATADEHGQPQCSYKGGDPGFVHVLDEHTIAFPSYDGNGMFLSLGNLRVNPLVGVLLVDFAGDPPRRLRIEGVASVSSDDELLASYPGAQLIVRVRVTRVFPNCPRYVHRLSRVERSPYVPDGRQEPPIPGWKRREWAYDVLPAGDPAAADSA